MGQGAINIPPPKMNRDLPSNWHATDPPNIFMNDLLTIIERGQTKVPKMNRDLPSNWHATDLPNMFMNDLLTIIERGQTKVKSNQVNFHHCAKVSGK